MFHSAKMHKHLTRSDVIDMNEITCSLVTRGICLSFLLWVCAWLTCGPILTSGFWILIKLLNYYRLNWHSGMIWYYLIMCSAGWKTLERACCSPTRSLLSTTALSLRLSARSWRMVPLRTSWGQLRFASYSDLTRQHCSFLACALALIIYVVLSYRKLLLSPHGLHSPSALGLVSGSMWGSMSASSRLRSWESLSTCSSRNSLWKKGINLHLNWSCLIFSPKSFRSPQN